MSEQVKVDNRGKVTWGDLKQALEQAGVQDHDEIDRIDLGWGNPNHIKVVHDDDFGWQIFL